MFGAEFVGFGVRTCPHQIAEGLMLSIWHPDRREVATAQQPRQLERIASIGLDLVAWPYGNQRGRHHHALDAQLGELPVQRVPRRPSFVGHPQLNVLATQLPHQLANGVRIVGDRAVAARRTLFFGDGHRDRRAMHVQTDVPQLPMLHHFHWADLHACSSTQDELRPPAQPTVLRAPALPY